MKFNRTCIAILSAGIFAIAAIFLISCATGSRAVVVAPLEIPGAHYVGNRICSQCHAQTVRGFDASPHARLILAETNVPGGIGCESCHGPGSKHVETGGAKFIINPGREPDACFRCHLQTRGEFQLPQHHPVIEGHMSCSQCHDPHGVDILKPADGGLAMARLNENCAQCHREQTRPFVFEHPAMREGCATCHNPHGSINRMMLKQPDNNLCLRCHTQTQGPGVPAGEFYIGATPHAALMQMGSCWSAGCHTAVHGSDVDIRLRY